MVEQTNSLAVAPPPWENQCSEAGCVRPASPQRTVGNSAQCNYHYLLYRATVDSSWPLVAYAGSPLVMAEWGLFETQSLGLLEYLIRIGIIAGGVFAGIAITAVLVIVIALVAHTLIVLTGGGRLVL
ncbi:hypothetical protein [Halobellus sp. Atlit-38R]|uniref:hypothetical protein n=1 Tax=Halobellus sp. Atlit-38R TaxID=2282131 RepID=UPI0011C473FC|nr:hypothetical protein [Halobellus sp. Atlit-38R]